jgi:hypothetical protein
LYYHLRASGSIIRDLQKDVRCRDEGLIGFLAEKYSYLAIVANISTGQGNSDRLLDARSLPQPLRTLNQETLIYRFIFGFSHRLFEIIPRIAYLSIKYRAQESSSKDIQNEYNSIISEVNACVSDNKSGVLVYKLAG